MNAHALKPLRIFAPAKINLYLHITGKRHDGYHELDSLISFADIGDTITIEFADQIDFQTNGPFGAAFTPSDIINAPHSPNLVVRALWALAKLAEIKPSVKITLDKQLPLASGIGGGSADAAATIWGLCELWGLPKNLPGINDLLLQLGADVPVCYACETARVTGIGEILEPITNLPEIPLVLVNPGKPCATKDVFQRLQKSVKAPTYLPPDLDDIYDFCDFLNQQNNDLETPARQLVPEIGNVLNAIAANKDCLIARLSGSGATCFGLYDTPAQAQSAAKAILSDNPDWWVRHGLVNLSGRY